MNRASLLHIIERLEAFLTKLPSTIQKPVMHELTPLKQLFLQQRPPRFVLTGANDLTVQEVVTTLFPWVSLAQSRDILMELFRWQRIDLSGEGTIELLDARGAVASAIVNIREELREKPTDVFLHLADATALPRDPSRDLGNLENLIGFNAPAPVKIIGIIVLDESHISRLSQNDTDNPPKQSNARSKLHEALQKEPQIRERLLQIVELSFRGDRETDDKMRFDTRRLMSLLAHELPNEARIEMVRIARDREVQIEIAQMLIKSTTAVSTAIGAQPIPLADLPILTALQLAMVSGIMYISGRERSLRAATEFVGALGVNVGAGMLLREGTRALLKFFPGWGNVVCGVVAGAGTYAIGRAAVVYFLEGVSLKEARRTYLSNRKKRPERSLPIEQNIGSSV